MTIKLQTENDSEFLKLKGGCTGTSKSTLVKCHIVGNHMSQLNFDVVTHWKHLIETHPMSITTNEPRHMISNNVAF